MQKFKDIYNLAKTRKGGKSSLEALLPNILSNDELSKVGDDRFLAMMIRAINQAGFNWSVIANKWPQFEEAFFNFDVEKLSKLSLEDWDEYTVDKRVVRNWIKIKAIMENVAFVKNEAQKHGSFANFIASWPQSDQVGLMLYLKKHGSRLGGKTGQWFLRYVGKDSFVITKDVCLALKNANIDISESPTSQRELRLIQEAFNKWHKETNLSYCHLIK